MEIDNLRINQYTTQPIQLQDNHRATTNEENLTQNNSRIEENYNRFNAFIGLKNERNKPISTNQNQFLYLETCRITVLKTREN